MSHIFRAFFAPMANRAAPLANSRGQVTQAVYIFTNMLRKLLQDEKPTTSRQSSNQKRRRSARDVCRLQSQPAGHAGRPGVADSLHPATLRGPQYSGNQLTWLRADDVIGTLAKRSPHKNLQAVIVSNDKDMCQLVSDPNVVCMRTNSAGGQAQGVCAAN